MENDDRIPSETGEDKNRDMEMAGHFTIRRLLKHSSIPIITLLLSSLYMVVDGLFIANFTSETSYAASILVTSYALIFPGVGFMLGGGGNALLGKLLGEDKPKEARDAFSMLIEFTVISGLLLTILGLVFLKPFLVMQGASGELMREALRYGTITLIGTTFLSLQYEFQLFLITEDKEVRGFVYTLIAGITNIVLDALFILVMHMGVTGAALGTLSGELVGSVIPMVFFLRKRDDSVLYFRPVVIRIRMICDACLNGLSEMVENIAENIVGVIYNFHLLRIAGEAAVDAYGSVMYIFMICTLTFVGYNESVVPVIAYHFGAENRTELKSLFDKSLLITGAISVIFFAAVMCFAHPLAAMFADGNEEILNMAVQAFRINAFALIPMGVSMFVPSFFTGRNDGRTSALVTVFEMLIFPIITVTALSRAFGLVGIWASESATWILSALLCLLVIHRQKRKGQLF